MEQHQYEASRADSEKCLIKSALILFATIAIGALFGYFCSLISNT